MEFHRQLFGYHRTEVDERLKRADQELHQCAARLEVANHRIAELEAELEEHKIAIDVVRRQLAQSSITAGAEPIVIMIGPSDHLGGIVGLIDSLESSPYVTPEFRVYRDGFYRLDGVTTDRAAVVGWLRAHPDVAVVDQRDDAIFAEPHARWRS